MRCFSSEKRRGQSKHKQRFFVGSLSSHSLGVEREVDRWMDVWLKAGGSSVLAHKGEKRRCAAPLMFLCLMKEVQR